MTSSANEPIDCSERLAYEPLTAAHAPALYPLLSPAIVWQHIGPSEAESVAALTERFAHLARGSSRPGERWENFAVRLRDGDYCGQVQATVYGEWAEIAYLIGPQRWGRGIGAEAAAWLCARLERQGVRELWAATRPENHASRRLLDKLGFAPSPSGVRPLASEDAGDLLYVRRG